jgi:hypothetical protein
MKKIFVSFVAIVLLLAGCESGSECVNCPPTGVGPTPNPTLQNIWPNRDGTSWVYDHTARVWEADLTFYPTREDVPSTPLPSWYKVFNYLQTNVPPTATSVETGTLTLTFEGMTTTPAGVTAQNLNEEIVLDEPPGRAGASRNWIVDRPWTPNAEAGILGRAAMQSGRPLLLHGGAWEKNSEWIGTYGDINQDLAWKFLTSDLRMGATFTFQLVPQLADNIFLHCIVYRQVVAKTEVGTFTKALDCLYMIDYGVAGFTDQQGGLLGYARVVDLGRVIYAPTIGPVYSYERRDIELTEPLPAGLSDTAELLVGTSLVNE